MSSLSFEPLISLSFWAALALLGGAMLLWHAVRRPPIVSRARWGGIIVLMSLGFASLLVILLNPTWLREIPPPAGKPLLSVLVDSSASMNTPDADLSQRRFVAAGKMATALSARLGDRFDVRVRAFSDSAKSVDPSDLEKMESNGMTTDLANVIESSIDPSRPAGQAIVLVSDGITNAEGGSARVLESVRLAKAMAVPIYTQTVGGKAGSLDLSVDIRSTQELAIVGQKVPITARVKFTGLTPYRAQLTLMQGRRELARESALVKIGDPVDVHFMVQQEKIGVYPYDVHVEPVPGEVSQANNSATYVLRVVDEPIRVLVLEGKPYWDSKFFMRTLASDQAVAIESIVSLTQGRFVRRTLSRQEVAGNQPAVAPATSPTAQRVDSYSVINNASAALGDIERLRGYQIVVIGRDAEVFLNDAAVENLSRWVSRDGGSLVCYRGAPMAQVNQKLARLLPVQWTRANESRFRVKLTDQGKDLNWFIASGDDDALGKLPTLQTTATVNNPKPLAVVLASAQSPGGRDSSPAVVYQPYGQGRVVVIEGSGMWRWAFLPPEFKDQEQVYASLWHSMMRWLTSGGGLLPGQKMNLRADKIHFGTDEPSSVTLVVRDEGGRATAPAVELLTQTTAQSPATYTPSAIGGEIGLFHVNFGKLPAGRYEARIAGAATDDPSAHVVFEVQSFGEEEINLQARPDLMARIAQDSGGVVLDGISDAGPRIVSGFNDFLRRSRPAQFERISAWDRWWLMLGVVGLWGLSWGVRRAGGLI